MMNFHRQTDEDRAAILIDHALTTVAQFTVNLGSVNIERAIGLLKYTIDDSTNEPWMNMFFDTLLTQLQKERILREKD